MSGKDEIRLEGIVLELLSDRACRVELANGHQMVVHKPLKVNMDFSRIKPGDKLELVTSPFDLSKGRLTGN